MLPNGGICALILPSLAFSGPKMNKGFMRMITVISIRPCKHFLHLVSPDQILWKDTV